MVVYTPEQALNPEKKDVDDGIDIEIHMESKALTADIGDDDNTTAVYNDTTMPVVRERRHAKNRKRIWLQLFLFAGMILGITLCVLGSVELFGNMYTSADFSGRCGVGIVDMKKLNASYSEPLDLKSPTDQPKIVSCSVSYYEDIEIKGEIETFKVPKQNKSSAALIRHDFNQNMTAIRDELLNLCFIVPFLQEFTADSVPIPSEFSQFLSAQQLTEELPLVYEQDAVFSTVDPVRDMLTEFGTALADICYGATPLRVERLGEQTTTTTTTQPTTSDPFLFFHDLFYTMYPGGDAIFNYHIIITDPSWYDYGL